MQFIKQLLSKSCDQLMVQKQGLPMNRSPGGSSGSTDNPTSKKIRFFTTLRGVYNFVGPPTPPTPSLRPIELLPIEP